jgi:hypothetical protein
MIVKRAPVLFALKLARGTQGSQKLYYVGQAQNHKQIIFETFRFCRFAGKQLFWVQPHFGSSYI